MIKPDKAAKTPRRPEAAVCPAPLRVAVFVLEGEAPAIVLVTTCTAVLVPRAAAPPPTIVVRVRAPFAAVMVETVVKLEMTAEDVAELACADDAADDLTELETGATDAAEDTAELDGAAEDETGAELTATDRALEESAALDSDAAELTLEITVPFVICLANMLA